jgi:hypothetical protein
VVDEGALAVDLDDRQPLAVARLKRGVARDVDLVQLELELVAKRVEDPARPLAEVAVLRVVERYVTDRGLGSSWPRTLVVRRGRTRQCAC